MRATMKKEPVKLVPVQALEPELKEAMGRLLLRDPDATFWLRNCSNASWIYKPPDNGDWNTIARVVFAEGIVIGYVSASIDRESDSVADVTLLSLTPGVRTDFALAVRSFMIRLRREFRSVRWSCVEGSPHENGYRRMAERMDGKQLGVWPDRCRMSDGVIRGQVWFWAPGIEREVRDLGLELVAWWNDQAEMIEERIRVASETDEDEDSTDTQFFWGQLVWQELTMWLGLGDPVDEEALDFMVKRRGFNDVQRVVLIAGLEVVSLWSPAR